MKRIFSILFVLVLAVSLMLVPAAPVGASPGPGIVGLWHLDGNANDSSGNNLNGTVSSSGASFVSGKFGQALSVDGTGYVRVPNSTLLEPSEITVEAWVKRLGSPGSAIYIVSKYLPNKHGAYSSYGLYTGSGGLRFYIGYSGGWIGSPQASASAVWDGNWHHVAGTFDGSQIKLYLDGVQVDGATSTLQDIYYSGTGDLFIGSYYNGSWLAFSGEIDEVRIWDEAVNPVTVPLYAGQNMDAGTVTVWNDSTDLHVEYQTSGGWCLTETHLHVATSLDDIPQKNGNPPPGQFDYKAEHDCATAYTYTIPLDEGWVPCETDLVIAAHAVVVDTSSMMTTTVVSEPGVDVYGPLGVYAGLDDAAWGISSSALATWLHSSWPSIEVATWISTAYYVEDIENDSWMWFHDEITIPGYPSSGMVLATADNAEEFYFNGTFVGSDGDVHVDYYDDAEWGTIIQYPIAPKPGVNTLDFIVRNYAAYYPDKNGTYTGGDPPDPELNPAGLIYKAEVNYYQEETAWGDGLDFDGKNWATYFMYHVQ